ncbi:MAG: hypothetical protein LC637_06095 [Xanthomonadaceae bacterium]|nr:hypothetical protein [Xanthomonadaceae bacterium]
MAKYICDVEHPKIGPLEVYETANGARVYGLAPEVGQIPFQDKRSQDKLRGLVIMAGQGQKLSRKPSALELANFAQAPATPDPAEESPAPVPESKAEPAPETVPEKQARRPFWLFGGRA